jgi:hypothetical protein
MTVNLDNEKIQTFNADFLDMLMQFGDWTPAPHLSLSHLEFKYDDVVMRFHIKFTHNAGRLLRLTLPPNYSFIDNSLTNCHITIPASSKNEFLFLLCESNKDIENSPDISFVQVFSSTLIRVCRIFGGAEPLSLDDQKGLIGEINAISLLKRRFGDEVLKGWSRNGLVDIDINHLGYDIEVKTVSDVNDPNVNVSFHNQLQYKESVTSFLFVMECKSTRTDLSLPTLPDLIDQIIETDYGGEDSDLGSKFVKCLEKEIESYPWSAVERNRFTSRFEVSDSFSAYKILEGCAADQMALGTSIPDGVTINKYKLDAKVLEEFEDISVWLESSFS